MSDSSDMYAILRFVFLYGVGVAIVLILLWLFCGFFCNQH